MRYILIFCLLFSVTSTLHAQLSDDFSDGDFTANPVWSGDTGEFQINGTNELQSNGPAATATLSLSTPNSLIENTTWEFLLRLDFSPSGSNAVKIYLVSNQADLEADLNGYYIGIGESGSSDGIDLYRQSGNTSTKIIEGSTAILSASSNNQARIRVSRDASGNWTLEADATGGTTYVQEGTVLDNTFTSTSSFGVSCSHTSTRNTLFFFDDFSITGAPSNIALQSASASSANPSEVQVLFSEAVDLATAQTVGNYSINNGAGTPTSATVDGTNPALVKLALTSPLMVGNYILTANNVQDLAQANTITANSTASFSFTVPVISLQSASVSSSNPSEIQVLFSEPADLTTAQTVGNYNISGIGLPTSATVDGTNPALVRLGLSAPLTSGSYILTANNVRSLAQTSTIAANSTVNFSFTAPIGFNQIIISELMADPSPVVGLPEDEFIELYNGSGQAINLLNVTFTDLSTTATLPSYTLPANGYLIVCAISDTTVFKPFGNVLGVSSFPGLNNTGEQILLRDAYGNLIFQVTYDDDWYGDDVKKGGGYTLEMIDVNFPCLDVENWTASDNPSGGTPGQANSIGLTLSDNLPPALVSAFGLSSDSLLLTFNEKLEEASIANATFSVSGGVTVQNIRFDVFNAKQIVLETSTMSLQTDYTVNVSGLQDCSGNLLTSTISANFGIPEPAESLDIILNEVTPEAFSGGKRFVEIYNNSAKFINLAGWQIGRVDETGAVDADVPMSNSALIIAPNSYYAFTGGLEQTKSDYPSAAFDRIIETSADIPSFGYDEENQTVVLLDANGNEMDRFVIEEEFQFDLLADSKGVSLERVDFNSPTNDGNNWASAASTVGYGTPGYLNSQNIDNSKASLGGDCFELSPEVFSPDNDGMADITTIHYTCNQNNLTATITIYDAFGRLVKRLVQNRLLATQGFIQWDGTTDAGEKARVGYYIVLIETFKLDGTSDKIKKTVAVGAKF